jgi:nucleoid DNA-binding protein
MVADKIQIENLVQFFIYKIEHSIRKDKKVNILSFQVLSVIQVNLKNRREYFKFTGGQSK